MAIPQRATAAATGTTPTQAQEEQQANTRNIQPTTHYPLPTTYDLPTSCYHLLPIHWILHQHEQRALAGQAQPLPRRYGVVRTFFLSPGDYVLHFPNH